MLEDEESQLGARESSKNAASSSTRMTRHDIMIAQEATRDQEMPNGDFVRMLSNNGGVDDVDRDRGLQRNMNREIGINDEGARNVDEAIAQLTSVFAL